MLTGIDVLKDYEGNIPFSSFHRNKLLRESSKFGVESRNIMAEKGVYYNECFLHTTTARETEDICNEIRKCDYIWFKDGRVVAFWKKETQTLYF